MYIVSAFLIHTQGVKWAVSIDTYIYVDAHTFYGAEYIKLGPRFSFAPGPYSNTWQPCTCVVAYVVA